jgi:hypothetical protein
MTEKKDFSTYFASSQNFVKIPDNQFAHAWGLISSKGRNITNASEHTELMDPNAFLGFFDSDNLIRLYQNDAVILENLFAIAKKSKSDALFEVFDVLYNSWLFEIRLTANKQGIERRLQNSFSGGINAEGFGKIIQDMEKKRQQAEYERQQKQQGGMF